MRKHGGRLDVTPTTDALIEEADVMVASARRRRSGGSSGCSSHGKSLPASAVDRLAARIGEALGTEVELERPKDPSHGDYATNVAMRSAKAAERPPRELAQEYAGAISALPEVERAEVAGPGFINVWVGDGFYLDALGEIERATAAAGPTRPSASRSRWCPRTRPARSSSRPPGTAPTATRSRGCSSSEGTRSREYYYNDAGAQMDRFRESIAAVRRGEPVAEDGYRGAYVEELARADGDPVPKMLASIEHTMERFRVHFDSWALQSELEQRLPELLRGARHLRAGRCSLGPLDRVRRREGPRAPALAANGRRADVPRRRRRVSRDKLERGFDRAIYVLGADHHGDGALVRRDRAHARSTTPRASKCCSTSSST